MRCTSPSRSWRWALLTVVSAALTAAALSSPAHADTPAPTPSPTASSVAVFNPSPQLQAARTDLAAKAAAAQQAAADYDAAKAAEATAHQQAGAARAAAAAATSRATAARAQLGVYAANAYIAGGKPAAIAAALQAGSPTEVVARNATLDVVVGSSADLLAQLRAAEQDAATQAARAGEADERAAAATAAAAAAATAAQEAAATAAAQVASMTAQEAASQQAAVLVAQAAAYSTTSGAQVTSDGVPVALLPFGNGHIPPEALSPIATDPSHVMWAPAARAFEAMQAAAAADGVHITISETYRPYEEQVQLAATKGLYSEGGLAAEPGTSNHGWGIAADLNLDSAAQAWMTTHAAAFGYVNDVPRELWHWRYYVTGA